MSSEVKSLASFQPNSKQVEQDAKLVESFLQQAATKSPNWLKPVLTNGAPIAGKGVRLLYTALPYVYVSIDYGKVAYTKLEPYRPDLLLPMIIGLVMILFGGYFMTLIAVAEAFRITGWDNMMKQFRTLYDNWNHLRSASKDDDKKDDNNDGIPDVEQIDAQSLLIRKVRLFLIKSDPSVISGALSAIYSGIVAMFATLKLQFARTISLGVSIGDILNSKVGQRFIVPTANRMVDKDYQKWVEVGVSYLCKSIGVTIAWSLQRILAAFHSALRGAQIFTNAFAVYTKQFGYDTLSNGYWDEAFAAVCALVGLYLQITTAFSMPWFLAIPLFPALLLEKILSWMISFSV